MRRHDAGASDEPGPQRLRPPTSGLDDQCEAYEVSLAAGVNLFDTAAMYGDGVSERRLGERTESNDRVRGLAEPRGRTPAQVALRRLVQQPGVVPIPGAKNGRQAAKNAGALSFELSDQEILALPG